ncbi:serine hydroxymethyltransferase [Vibrio splendidus 12B01]|nr:serine hydroxymethyltransferase [Vibrio splendidus 12B01]EAQ55082.1 serine hydroxymethyltransferase [Vibrio sp. MED222]
MSFTHSWLSANFSVLSIAYSPKIYEVLI